MARQKAAGIVSAGSAMRPVTEAGTRLRGRPVPRGPKGQKRPAAAVANAVHVMRIATGEVEDEPTARKGVAGSRRGGEARAKKLTPEQRSEIARTAAQARWKRGR